MDYTLTRRRAIIAAGGVLAGSVPVAWELSNGSSTAVQADAVNGWSMAQHDPGGTSYAPDARPPKDGVRIRWKQPLTMTTFAPPIIANGLVYGAGKELVCVDAASGTVVFRDTHSLFAPAFAMTGADQQPTLAVPTADGAVGLHPKGGQEVAGFHIGRSRWQTPNSDTAPPSDYSDALRGLSAPVAVDGTVFVNPVGTGLMAIDASSGQLRWRKPHGKSRPVVRDGTVYIIETVPPKGDRLAGYDIESGNRTFTFKPENGQARTVTAGPETLIVQTNNHELLGVNYDETRRWRYSPTKLTTERHSAAVAKGVVYAGFKKNDRSWLIAIDGAKGTELWRRELPKVKYILGSPSVANDVVDVPIRNFERGAGLAAVDAIDGHIRWQFFPTDSSSAISPATLANKTIYVIGGEKLYALEESG